MRIRRACVTCPLPSKRDPANTYAGRGVSFPRRTGRSALAAFFGSGGGGGLGTWTDAVGETIEKSADGSRLTSLGIRGFVASRPLLQVTAKRMISCVEKHTRLGTEANLGLGSISRRLSFSSAIRSCLVLVLVWCVLAWSGLWPLAASSLSR